MTAPVSQGEIRAGVLMPALVEAPFDYLVPPVPVGTLVEAKLAGRSLIGAVWREGGDAAVPLAKVKPVTRVLTEIPPLAQPYRDWLDWISEFTLAPKGAVLNLCGLAHAAKQPKKGYQAPNYTISLPELTPSQQEITQQLLKDYGKPTLLDGVTGSGKTEVYFHLIADVLNTPSPLAGEGWGEGMRAPPQVLIMLPEIALTHQWLARFTQTFGVAPIVWHSRMTPVAKARAWQAVARGEARVVVGARSALFLPFAHLKRIIVDEEHDPSYKQEDGVLYHARDMAVARGRFEKAEVLLVSATPALETLENSRAGKYRTLHLTSRFGSAGLPTVKLVDMRADAPERGDFLSPSVKQGLLRTLERGEQALFFLNRRGYAPLLLCRKCGHRFECENCSAWLTVHGRQRLECHHCGHREQIPSSCPSCKSDKEMLAPCGPGVERIAEEVRQMFEASPNPPRVAILSSDETIAPETWEAIEKGEIDILVGTQMVAKGHHFPRLTFVAVVDADVGLSGADLRAGERTYQLLHQLGGRAGRGELPGTVLIQSYEPEHPVMESLMAQDRERLMKLEAAERKAGGWPPFGQLAAILLDGVDEQKVRAAGQSLARSAPEDARLTVLGPAPAPLSKLRGQYRYRLLVKAKPGIHLQRTLRNWLAGQKFSGVRVKVDVNPYYFL